MAPGTYFVDETGDKKKWITEHGTLAENITAFTNDFSSADTKHNLRAGIYLRGQPDEKDGLLPSLGRPKYYAGKRHTFTAAQERNMLHRFRRRSYKQFGRILGDWEALFLARHHGLPTRLLDWTANPLVALYWASVFEREPKPDGAIWAFLRHPEETYDLNVLNARFHVDYEYASEFKIAVNGVKVIYPFDISERMVAQAGIFTIQDDPRKELERYDPGIYERKDFDIQQIRKWKVPSTPKAQILQQLNDIGINRQTLYPDIDGLAEGTWQIEVIRSGVDID